MKLKNNIDFISFLDTVSHCTKDVWFETDEGDRINLKSELSKYIFAAVSTTPSLIEKGRIKCDLKSDYDVISSFIEPV